MDFVDISEFDNSKKKKKKKKKKQNPEMVKDAAGNSVLKGSATDPSIVAMRAQKKAAREARAAASAPKTEQVLSKRQLQKRCEQQQRYEECSHVGGTGEDPLDAFSVTLAGGSEAEKSSGAVLSIEGFSIAAPSRPLFVDATLKLTTGRRYGLLGNNGSGKSTLLKLLASRRLPLPSRLQVLLVEQEIVASEISVTQQVLAADEQRTALLLEEEALSHCLDVAAQRSKESDDESEEWWAANLSRLAEVGELLEACDADAAESRVSSILNGLGFSAAMQASGTTTLSGGWRMRVSLARALFMAPTLLLLDEPTNHLDLEASMWLDDHLSRVFKGTLLVVSHDAEFLSNACTDILFTDSASRLSCYRSDVYSFLASKEARYNDRTKLFEQQQKIMKAMLGKGSSKKAAVKKTMEKLKVGALIERPREYKVSFEFPGPEDTSGPTSISVLDVSFSYPASEAAANSSINNISLKTERGGKTKKKQLFRGLNFSVDDATRAAIVGKNGSGKSTLIRLCLGALEPTAGEVLRGSRIRIGVYDQHFAESLPSDQSPVAYLQSLYRVSEHDARKRLGMFGLDGARHLIKIANLSGGQKARVVFAAIALQRPHVMLLDEPTNHLDIESVDALIDGLKRYSGGVLVVSHDARLIASTECDLWVCEGAAAVSSNEERTGLRVERRGFERYRRDVLKEMATKAAEEHKKAAARAESRRRQRASKLKQHSERRANKRR